MTHLDEELLAQWALDEDGPDTAAAEHLQHCARCHDSLTELRAIAAAGKQLPRLESPPADVWSRVSAELDLDTRPPRSEQPEIVISRQPHQTTRRRRGLAVAAAVAAVIGAGAGVAGTLLVTSDDNTTPTPQAVIRLEPLAGKTGDGTADLIDAGGRLKVAAAGLNSGQGFYEVWLINVDGKRMVSLGVLDPRTGGTFQIPPNVTAQGYRIVDVSLEPDDGNPEHSHNSIIRGTLPG